ncbi:MAG: hypothetical protein LWW93_13085 [Hyphomicrobiales bacterium]|nr:hypothetical protein [Hyphomicrobiales bacterium]MCE1237277.1 hypothetical protein [Hyphomicrobiales bacterium]
MTTARKLFAAALVATTVAVASVGSATAAPPPFPHPHHHHHGAWGVGGLAAGLIIGSAIASQRSYEDPEPRCVYVERVNRWGEVVTRRVCRW